MPVPAAAFPRVAAALRACGCCKYCVMRYLGNRNAPDFLAADAWLSDNVAGAQDSVAASDDHATASDGHAATSVSAQAEGAALPCVACLGIMGVCYRMNCSFSCISCAI